MTLPQPEIYRDYIIFSEFDYTDSEGDYTGVSDWIVQKAGQELADIRSCMTLEQVKESIDDLLNQ